jgi:SpoIID/LytB domain protein
MDSTYHRAELPRHRTEASRRRPRKGAATLVVGLAVALCLGAAAGRPGAARANTLVIAGAGDGHGVGMSQEGALGYAQHGYDYQAILAHYYTGTTIGQAPPKWKVRVMMGDGRVRKVPLEAYVRGVVAAEMSPGWPPAALEAQAIASRTYALTSHAGEGRFDVYADSRSQVYRGRAGETPQSNRAVRATAGEIVTYAGRPAITYFFASSGGRTENVQDAFPGAAPEPWLRGVVDPFDTGPLHSWRTSMSFAAAASDLKGLVRGRLRGIEVLSRGFSPRIITASILGSKGATPIGGEELASRLGLYDTWAYFSVSDAQGTRPEPDRSGAPAQAAPAPVTGPDGGTTAGAGQGTGGGAVAP